jgi:hypothetical protein
MSSAPHAPAAAPVYVAITAASTLGSRSGYDASVSQDATRVSVRFGPGLLLWLGQKSRQTGHTKDDLIIRILENQRQTEWRESFADGCREFADEMRTMADTAHAAQAEIALS